MPCFMVQSKPARSAPVCPPEMIINDCRFIASVSIPPLDLLVHRYRQHAKSGEPGNDECPHYANPNFCEPFEQDGRLHDPTRDGRQSRPHVWGGVAPEVWVS